MRIKTCSFCMQPYPVKAADACPYCSVVDLHNDGAILSDDKLYRYRLWRTLPDGVIGRGLFIMLNPSTATASIDDPTIKRCTGFAKRFGWTRYDVVNLFSYRTADPLRLRGVDSIGPEHHAHALRAILEADVIICAWGADRLVQGSTFAASMLEGVRAAGKVPLCLGKNKDGSPCHPLYLKSDTKLGVL